MNRKGWLTVGLSLLLGTGVAGAVPGSAYDRGVVTDHGGRVQVVRWGGASGEQGEVEAPRWGGQGGEQGEIESPRSSHQGGDQTDTGAPRA